MFKLTWLLPLGVLVGSFATAAGPDRSIPEGFQGEWNTRLADCGTARNDTRLRIGDDWLAFHESEGELEVFATQGARELALIALLQGEGERWRSFRHFRLSDDGKRLTDITYGRRFDRLRCP